MTDKRSFKSISIAINTIILHIASIFVAVRLVIDLRKKYPNYEFWIGWSGYDDQCLSISGNTVTEDDWYDIVGYVQEHSGYNKNGKYTSMIEVDIEMEINPSKLEQIIKNVNLSGDE